MTDDDVKLRECPFCDGASSRRSTDEAGNKWVVCDDCGGRAYEMDWNRRPTSSSPDGRALKAAQQIVDAIAAIKGKKLAIAFRDEATAQHVGMIIENAAKVSRALLNRPNSSSADGRMREALEKIAAETDDAECCGRGVYSGHPHDPPECCGQPNHGFERMKSIARAALSPNSEPAHNPDESKPDRR